MSLTKLLFYLLLLAVGILGFVFYRWVFDYLILSFVFAYLLAPAVSWLERKRLPRWSAIVLVYSAIIVVITGLIYRYAPEMVEQGNNLLELVNSENASREYFLSIPLIHSLHEFLLGLDGRLPVLNLAEGLIDVIDMFKDFLVKLPTLIVDNYQMILGTLSFVATIPLIGFFLLKDGNKLMKDIYKMVPNRYFELCIIIMNKIHETVGKFLRAMIFEVVAVSIMASVALSIVGVKNAILIGIVAGLANIIPYFGPLIGTLVAIATLLISGTTSFLPILNVIIAMYSVQIIDNNIVYPVVVGKAMSMHPLIVLLTVLAGGWYGGILWMLISVPLVYMIYSIIRVLFENLKKFHLI